MADLFRTNYYTGEAEEAQAGLGRTIANIGSTLFLDLLQQKESEEYSNSIGKWIDETSDFEDWQRENVSHPEQYINELDNRRDRMLNNMLEGVTTPKARRDITNKFNVDFKNMRKSVAADADRQAKYNRSIAFDINYDKLLAPPNRAITENDIEQTMNSISLLIHENEGEIDRLITEEQADYEETSARKAVLGNYIIQESLREGEFINTKELEDKFGVEFNGNDIAQLQKSFEQNQSKADADKRLEAAQKQKDAVQLFTDKLTDPQENGWISDTDYNTLASAIGDEEHPLRTSWKEIVANQADEPAKKTDWEKYNELEQKIFDYWNGEFEAEIEDVQTEIALAYKGKKKYLTEIDYKNLLSRLNIDMPKETLQNYKSIYDKAKSLIRNKKNRKIFNEGLFAYVIKNPDASYNDMKKLLTVHEETRAKSWIEIIQSTPGFAQGGVPNILPKPAKPIEIIPEKSVKIESAPDIMLDMYWGKLDDETKKKVWEYYQNGFSAEDIINALE